MFKPFVDRCLAGEVEPSDIDDWVTAWHNSEPGSEQMSLYEYLGFTEVEGRMWSRDARAPAPILENRRRNRQPA